MKYEFEKQSIEAFMSELASKSSVPGGGGAAGLIAATGAALSSMVANLTVGKPKYAGVNDDMVRILADCEGLRERLISLMNRDAEAFEPLSRAYRLPSDTEEEKAEKTRVMEQCLRDSALVPLELMKACCAGIDMALELSEKGSRLVLSDAGCAAAAFSAALRSAWLNVCINTSSMQDRAYAQKLEAEGEELLSLGLERADRAYFAVLSALKRR